MADRWANEATRSLHQLGFGVRSDPTAKYATGDEPGRSDLMIMRRGLGGYIEIKSDGLSFSFASLRSNQREWIETYGLKQGPCWIWLFMGIHPPNRNPKKYFPRRAWLMPYAAFLEYEALLAPYQGSIPYQAERKPGMRVEVAERQLDAEHVFAPWALQWRSPIWVPDRAHPFFTDYRLGDLTDDAFQSVRRTG